MGSPSLIHELDEASGYGSIKRTSSPLLRSSAGAEPVHRVDARSGPGGSTMTPSEPGHHSAGEETRPEPEAGRRALESV